jgi:hypothetical protein
VRFPLPTYETMVNNAGIFLTRSTDFSVDDFQRLLQLNVR